MTQLSKECRELREEFDTIVAQLDPVEKNVRERISRLLTRAHALSKRVTAISHACQGIKPRLLEDVREWLAAAQLELNAAINTITEFLSTPVAMRPQAELKPHGILQEEPMYDDDSQNGEDPGAYERPQQCDKDFEHSPNELCYNSRIYTQCSVQSHNAIGDLSRYPHTESQLIMHEGPRACKSTQQQEINVAKFTGVEPTTRSKEGKSLGEIGLAQKLRSMFRADNRPLDLGSRTSGHG